MKAHCLMILLLALPLTSTAQDTASAEPASDLRVVSYALGPISRVDVSRPDPPPNAERNTAATEINPPRYQWQAKAKLEIQNTGTRTIRSFDWGLLLVFTTPGAKQTRSYTVHFRKAVRPGEMVTVSSWIKNPTLEDLTKHKIAGTVEKIGQITRIEYDDESIWKGPLIWRP